MIAPVVRTASACCGIALVLALGACRSSAPLVPTSDPLDASAAVAPSEPGVQAFEQRHRQAAQAARREGRHADARWHWDVVAALHPDDAQVTSERRTDDDAARTASVERAAKAHAARQRGDAQTAARLYLEALQVWPLHADAADELRVLERERTRRGHVQALQAMRSDARGTTGPDGTSASMASSPAAPRKSMAASKLSPRAKAAKDARIEGTGDTPQARIDAEHAALMTQADAYGRKSPASDADSAAAGITGTPARAAASVDTDACRRAPRLEGSDRAAAVRAWQQCLKAQPGHVLAAARLKALAP